MNVTIFEIAATIPAPCNDGRRTEGVWGHEKQFHATRASAETACSRLRAGGYWGCSGTPHYDILELTRDNFGDDPFSDAEWRKACHQAGVDPVSGAVRA